METVSYTHLDSPVRSIKVVNMARGNIVSQILKICLGNHVLSHGLGRIHHAEPGPEHIRQLLQGIEHGQYEPEGGQSPKAIADLHADPVLQ